MTLEDELEAMGLTPEQSERVARLIIDAAVTSGRFSVDAVLRSLRILLNSYNDLHA